MIENLKSEASIGRCSPRGRLNEESCLRCIRLIDEYDMAQICRYGQEKKNAIF